MCEGHLIIENLHKPHRSKCASDVSEPPESPSAVSSTLSAARRGWAEADTGAIMPEGNQSYYFDKQFLRIVLNLGHRQISRKNGQKQKTAVVAGAQRRRW